MEKWSLKKINVSMRDRKRINIPDTETAFAWIDYH